MARLNLEDQFFIEVMPLITRMQDPDRAIGQAVRFFRYAQEKHKYGKLLTEAEFKLNNFDEALFPIFAERVDGGIKCIGAEKHFGWLKDRVEAGRKGGKSKNPDKLKHLKQHRSKTEAGQNEGENTHKNGENHRSKTEAKSAENGENHRSKTEAGQNEGENTHKNGENHRSKTEAKSAENEENTEAKPKPTEASSSSSYTTTVLGNSEILNRSLEHEIRNIVFYLTQKEILGANIGEVGRYYQEILNTFGSSEGFCSWLEDLINTNPLAKEETNQFFRRYISGAILSSIGVSNRAVAR